MSGLGHIVEVLASVGMAVGPPLVYADQAINIIRRKDSTGFSHDVCGVLLIANIIRIFFWLGNRFETPLLVQSILLIISQLLLLSICLHFKPSSTTYEPISAQSAIFDADGDDLPTASTSTGMYNDQPPSNSRSHLKVQKEGSQNIALEGREGRDTPDEAAYESRTSQPLPEYTSTSNRAFGFKDRFSALGGGLKSSGRNAEQGWVRPWGFWQWEKLGSYLEFLAGLIVVLGVLQIIFGRWMWYIDTLGFIALTIESTLPIPQFISNYKRKNCYGFRSSTLGGWLFGDTFKTIYFFVRSAPVQFKITAIMTVCWDCAVLVQRIIYKAEPPNDGSGGGDEENRGLRLGG